eukprot:jgi/Mesvir1/13097/Mv06076-RA.1
MMFDDLLCHAAFHHRRIHNPLTVSSVNVLLAMLIAEACKAPVYAIDLRGHGDSDKPDWGYHVARLAADLRDFLAALSLTRVVLVGSSMGAAVIWSFVELFGQDNIKGCVFIDQAPLQYRADDWQLGSNGCYDATTLKQLQQAVRSDFLAFAKGNADACLAQRLSPELEEYLVQETLKASQDALCQLMADHTQLDWRPILRRIRRPCLNLVRHRIDMTQYMRARLAPGHMPV